MAYLACVRHVRMACLDRFWVERKTAMTAVHEKTNREKAMTAKRGKHWCMSCDMALVGKVGKCPVCGERNNRKKRKE